MVITLLKEHLNSDSRPFYQYQQSIVHEKDHGICW